jgi:hypothetical protein
MIAHAIAQLPVRCDVRLWHKADITMVLNQVRIRRTSVELQRIRLSVLVLPEDIHIHANNRLVSINQSMEGCLRHWWGGEKPSWFEMTLCGRF